MLDGHLLLWRVAFFFFLSGLIGLTISLAPLLVGFMINDIQAKVDDFCLEMNEKAGTLL